MGRMPSATYRVVSAAIVNVLPVPALACNRVMPVGSCPQTSKGRGPEATSVIGRQSSVDDLLVGQQPVPEAVRVDAEARRL